MAISDCISEGPVPSTPVGSVEKAHELEQRAQIDGQLDALRNDSHHEQYVEEPSARPHTTYDGGET